MCWRLSNKFSKLEWKYVTWAVDNSVWSNYLTLRNTGRSRWMTPLDSIILQVGALFSYYVLTLTYLPGDRNCPTLGNSKNILPSVPFQIILIQFELSPTRPIHSGPQTGLNFCGPNDTFFRRKNGPFGGWMIRVCARLPYSANWPEMSRFFF